MRQPQFLLDHHQYYWVTSSLGTTAWASLPAACLPAAYIGPDKVTFKILLHLLGYGAPTCKQRRTLKWIS